MGQNQGKEGELGQDNSSAGPEEKGPSPDPGGATEEGNPTIETDGAGTDQEKAVDGRLDEGPGKESPSPPPAHGLDFRDKVRAPTDRGVVEGGDGGREEGRKSGEGGRAEPPAPQQLNGLTQSDTWESGEPDHERTDLEDHLDPRENHGCDLPGADEAESTRKGVSWHKKCTRDEMESVCGDDNELKCQDGKFDAACGSSLTNTGPTLEILETEDISNPYGEDGNTDVNFTDKALVITENVKTSMTESQNKRPLNKPGASNPVMNSQAETSKNITEAIQQLKGGIHEKPLEKVETESPNAEHSSMKNAETQGCSVKDVCGDRENVTGCRPTDDVIKTRFTHSSLAGADLQSKAVSLERAPSPEDLRSLEVASKIPLGHAESHRQISAGELTQDELQKERQFNVSDLESSCTKETSLERSPAGGHKNKDGIRETEERENLESASKALHRSHAKTNEIKDLSLRGTETEDACCVTSNIGSLSMFGENEPPLESDEDEKSIKISKDFTDLLPPFKSEVMQKDEKEDSPLLAKAKVHTEESLEQCPAEMSPQAETQTLPEMVNEVNPDGSSYLGEMISVEDAKKQQRLLEHASTNSSSLMSSERDEVVKSNTMSSKTDKETSATGSIFELTAGHDSTSGHTDADKKTEVALSASSQLQEQCFLKILTNASTHSTVSPTDISDQVRDGCAARDALADSTANTSAVQDVQHSSSMCSQISMQANEKRDQEQNKLSTQANLHVVEEKHSSQLDKKHATESDPTAMMETQQVAQKRHVSDMIKETIELQKKMKEWTKPAEARADLNLDPTQSVKVSQMKAAFDAPKKSPDKALERKPSMRKGRNISEKKADNIPVICNSCGAY